MNLEVVYPNPDDLNEEYSFEELRARSRGWMDRDWAAESKSTRRQDRSNREEAVKPLSLNPHEPNDSLTQEIQQDVVSQNTTEQLVQTAPAEDAIQENKAHRSKRTKIMEVKGETQTSMEPPENVDSYTH